jgi:general secretion pathway protein G
MERTGTRRKSGLLALIFAALASLVAAQLGCNVCHRSMEEAREASLLQNLFTLRHVVDEYTVDQHKRPQSLAELVSAGYLREVPVDPLTGRSDSWVVQRSKDPKTPGIVNVRSPSRSISSKGTAYCDW